MLQSRGVVVRGVHPRALPAMVVIVVVIGIGVGSRLRHPDKAAGAPAPPPYNQLRKTAQC